MPGLCPLSSSGFVGPLLSGHLWQREKEQEQLKQGNDVVFPVRKVVSRCFQARLCFYDCVLLPEFTLHVLSGF